MKLRSYESRKNDCFRRIFVVKFNFKNYDSSLVRYPLLEQGIGSFDNALVLLSTDRKQIINFPWKSAADTNLTL